MSMPRSEMYPGLSYRDPDSAISVFTEAFSFADLMSVPDGSGVISHATCVTMPGEQQQTPSSFTVRLTGVLDVIGTAWINAVRMTVIPLVVPLLIVGVAGSDDTCNTGAVGARAFGWFLLLLVTCALCTSLLAVGWLVKGATDVLKLPPTATGFVLPLGASVVKLTSAIYWVVGALFIARLYGLELSTPGIPSGGMLLQVPLYTAVGLPVEGIGIMIALDTLPDMFKTLLNVTADMLVAVMTAPREQSGASMSG